MVVMRLIGFGLAALIAGCAAPGTVPAPRTGWSADQLAKMDLDRVAEAHQREIFASLARLAAKLYKRNPRAWQAAGQPSREAALDRLLHADHGWRLAELDGRRGVDALQLAFAEGFAGDRVAALVVGLGGMVQTAFRDRVAFYATDELDPQAFHNAARNVEIAAWKLAQARDASGEPLLLANEAGPVPNLSFEREFGRIIGSLDVMAEILAEKNQRVVTRVLQGVASAVFLPVP